MITDSHFFLPHFYPICALMLMLMKQGKLSAFQTHGCDEVAYDSSPYH